MTTVSPADLANALRFLAIDAVEAANSGHPGMPMGMADVATVLYTRFLKFDPTKPHWADRDRFVLSAGHGSMLLYALSYLTGYKGMTLDELKRFRQLGSRTPGHPEHDVDVGIEMTTGPLGQGIATAVGMALAERMLNARFGDELVDHFTYVIASDGDMMEGVSHEAASLAGHLGLSRLIVLYDDNKICIDGPTSMSFSDDTLKRFSAYGWNTVMIDGHDHEIITRTIHNAQQSDKPTLIACRTTIGYGAPTKAGTSSTHGSPLGKDEVEGTRRALNWPHQAFEVPEHIVSAWRHIGIENAKLYAEWEQRLQASPHLKDFLSRLNTDLTDAAHAAIEAVKKETSEKQPKVATRQSSGSVLSALMPVMPNLVGGSADLTPSNNTKTKDLQPVTAQDYSGRYLHWGVREHGMATAMNGLALHGGFVPYGGTFLTFTDYCRPAIRLGAIMHQRVVYVMTHDSIGLGEDGPTHQPVEHLASLRAIPNVMVFRPADTVEAAECWQLALEHEGPSILALSRQALPTVRTVHTSENLSSRGAYILAGSPDRQITLMATGSEISLAMAARAELEAKGIRTTVVSVPSFELFAQQEDEYQDEVLGTAPRIGIEAAIQQGWDRWLGDTGVFIGMTGYGASAPAEQLYAHFGITVENIVKQAGQMIG